MHQAADQAAPLPRANNCNDNTATENGNMLENTHVPLNNLVDDILDEETAANVERLWELYNDVEGPLKI